MQFGFNKCKCKQSFVHISVLYSKYGNIGCLLQAQFTETKIKSNIKYKNRINFI